MPRLAAAIASVLTLWVALGAHAQDPWAWEPTRWPETLLDVPVPECAGTDFVARLDGLAEQLAAQTAPVVRGELSMGAGNSCHLRSFRSDATAGAGASTAWGRAVAATRTALARYPDSALVRAHARQVAAQRRRWRSRGPASMVHAGAMPDLTLEVLFEIDESGVLYVVVQRTVEHAVAFGGMGPCVAPPGFHCDPAGPSEVAHFEIEDEVRLLVPMTGAPRLGRHRLAARGPFAYD